MTFGGSLLVGGGLRGSEILEKNGPIPYLTLSPTATRSRSWTAGGAWVRAPERLQHSIRCSTVREDPRGSLVAPEPRGTRGGAHGGEGWCIGPRTRKFTENRQNRPFKKTHDYIEGKEYLSRLLTELSPLP